MLVQTPFPTSSFLFVYLPWFSFLWLKKFIRTGRFSLLLVFILYLSSLYNKNIVSVPLLCMAGCGLSQSRSYFPHLCWGCSQLNICWTLDLSCRTVMILSWPLGFHLVFPPALRKPGQLRWWHLHQEKYCNADESQNWPTNQPKKYQLWVESFLGDICSVLSQSRFVGSGSEVQHQLWNSQIVLERAPCLLILNKCLDCQYSKLWLRGNEWKK